MESEVQGVCVNVGCGTSPTPGWLNFDNSLSVRLAGLPLLPNLLRRAALLDDHQVEFIALARKHQIRCASATRLPVGSQKARVVYSSHMLEHLTRGDARAFVREAFRVLKPGGILRIVVPDLGKIVRDYGSDNDANRMVERTLLAADGSGLQSRLQLALIGPRNHRWMYDGPSLRALVAGEGFDSVAEVRPGETRIPDPGALDLAERADESVCVEGTRPW